MPFAIAPCGAHGETAARAAQAQVRDYRPVFQECRKNADAPLLAIRRMDLDGTDMFLGVDPATLATRLERAQDFSCFNTNDAQQKNTRYLQAVRSSIAPGAAAPAAPTGAIANGGLQRGTPTGSFVTGDLCPSRRPLDRTFLARLEAVQAPLPVALAISGNWLVRHQADFQWLRDQEHGGALRITWIDHSYHHPYVPGRPLAENFLLTRGSICGPRFSIRNGCSLRKVPRPRCFFAFRV